MSRYSQVTESDFFDEISRLLADRLAGDGRQRQDAVQIRRLLEEARTLVVGPSQVWHPLDPWLGQQLGLGPGSAVSDYVDRVLGLVTPQTVALVGQAAQAVDTLPAPEASLRHSGEGETEIDVREETLVPPETIAAASSLPPPPSNAVPPSSTEGRYVHLALQQQYLLTHPANTMMFDRMVMWPGGSAPIQHVGAGTTAAQELARVRFALMTKRGLTKLPDVLDITLAEVYEIKPRAQLREGMVQLHRNYLRPLHDAGLVHYRPGASWQAFPVLPVPPNRLALITHAAPGLLVYDLVVPPPPPSGRIAWRGLAVGALAVATVVLLFTPAAPAAAKTGGLAGSLVLAL
jgi:hypothetical protein